MIIVLLLHNALFTRELLLTCATQAKLNSVTKAKYKLLLCFYVIALFCFINPVEPDFKYFTDRNKFLKN